MKKKSIASILTILLILTIFSFTGCSQNETSNKPTPAVSNDNEPVKYRLAFMPNEKSAYNSLALEYQKLVEERSNGKIKFDIFPNGILGTDKELAEALQFGTVDCAIITSSPIVNFVSEFAVLDYPYVFRDWDHVWKFLESDIAQELYEATTKAKMITLTELPRGFRNFANTVRPLRTPDDIKGLKIRAMESPIYVESFKLFGANALAMSNAEVITALQQGTIEGRDNPLQALHDNGDLEYCNYVSETRHMFTFCGLMWSQDVWNKMSKEDQDLLRKAAEDATLTVGKLQEEIEKEYAKKISEKVNFNSDDIDRDAWKAAVEPMFEDFEKTNPKGYEFYERISGL